MTPFSEATTAAVCHQHSPGVAAMAEQYAHEVLKLVVARICQEIGFEAVEASALELLADIMSKYLEEIGFSSHHYAEVATRTESNFNDVRLALNDLRVTIMQLIPFEKNMPRIRLPITVRSFPRPVPPPEPEIRSEEAEELPEHIPPFLVPFPDSHTYKSTETIGDQARPDVVVRKKRGKRKRQIEEAVIRLRQTETMIEQDARRQASGSAPNPKRQKTEEVKNRFVEDAMEVEADHGEMTPVLPNTRHVAYMDTEEERDDGLDRVSGARDDDDLEAQRSLQRVDKILSSAGTDNIVRGVSRVAARKKPE